MVIAVDFDGCLCSDKFPDIGEPNWSAIEELKKRQKNGDKIILWTCRCDSDLMSAIAACRTWGIYFDAVNRNLPERIYQYKSDPRKISADEYWDDRSVKVAVLKGENV